MRHERLAFDFVADEYPREKFWGRTTEKPGLCLERLLEVAVPVVENFKDVVGNCRGIGAVPVSRQRLWPGVSLRVGIVKEARDLGKLFEVDSQTVVALSHVMRCGNAGKVRLVDRIFLTLRP